MTENPNLVAGDEEGNPLEDAEHLVNGRVPGQGSGLFTEDGDGNVTTADGQPLSVVESHTDRHTIRFDPETDDLQRVIDDAPEYAIIQGDRQTVYDGIEEPIEVETDGLLFRDIWLEAVPDEIAGKRSVLEITADDISIQNSEIDGGRTEEIGPYSGIDARGISGLQLHFVKTHSVGRDSLALHEATNIEINGFEAWDFGDDGIDAEDEVTDVRINGFWIRDSVSNTGIGGSNGIEIEQASHDWTISNGVFENITGGLAVRDGNGDPAHSVVVSNVIARNCDNSYRFGAITPDDWSDDPPEPTDIELHGCFAYDDTDNAIAIDGYDVTINGGVFENEEDGELNVVYVDNLQERSEEWGPCRVTFEGAGRLAGRVSYEDDSQGHIGAGWEMVALNEQAVFRATDDAGPVRLTSPTIDPSDRDPQIQARDDSTVYFDNVRDEDVEVVAPEDATVYVTNCAFGGFFDGNSESNSILEDYRVPVDVTGFATEDGANGYHDGSGDLPEGPASVVGGEWVSLVE